LYSGLLLRQSVPAVGGLAFSAIVPVLFSLSELRIEEVMAHTIKHKVPAAVKAWVKKEIADQRKLYKKIAKQMDDLGPKRAKWYEEFFERIQTRGFNVHFTTRRQIPDEELPKKPRRKDRVVW
jgi:hypothetical protein